MLPSYFFGNKFKLNIKDSTASYRPPSFECQPVFRIQLLNLRNCTFGLNIREMLYSETVISVCC